MTRHYPDLGSASDWLKQISHAARPYQKHYPDLGVTHHQYGISVIVSRTSFVRETIGGVAKCRLFSQASFRTTRVIMITTVFKKINFLKSLYAFILVRPWGHHSFVLVILWRTFHFISSPPPPKDDGFSNRGVRIFSSKKPTKFGHFRWLFQRCQQKINPLDLIFKRAPTKIWGFGFPTF